MLVKIPCEGFCFVFMLVRLAMPQHEESLMFREDLQAVKNCDNLVTVEIRQQRMKMCARYPKSIMGIGQ